MFDLRRFGRLAVVQWAEHGRSWLWFLGVGVGVHFCTLLLVTAGGKRLEDLGQNTQMAIYICGYLITGGLFALRYFSVLSNRDSALTCLMRPASALEKFLLAFLIVAVLYPLAYTLAFQLCNVPGALLGEAARGNVLATGRVNGYMPQTSYGPYLPFTDSRTIDLELQVLLGGMIIQALILVGTLYFRKIAWLKTLVALFVLAVLCLPLLSILTDASPDLLFWGPRIALPPGLQAWLVVLWIGVPALFWASAFFLLRERELQ